MMTDRSGNDGGAFFELGAFRTALQALREEYASADPEAVGVIEAAERLASSDTIAPEALASEREQIRRQAIDSQLIDELGDRAPQVGEESYLGEYALNEVLQAAAVGNGSLILRNLRSIAVAVSAKQQQQIGRARDAYTDVAAGLQILDRVFQGIDGLAQAQETVRRGWEAVSANSPGGLDLFDPEGDPAADWQRLLMWNTDTGSGHGLLSQADATMRLALHFEHWMDRTNRALDEPVAAMIAQSASMKSADDEAGGSLLAGRLLVTIGDALLEVAQWKLATTAFARAIAAWPEDVHPVRFHAAVQEAFAWLMLGDMKACRARLDGIDGARLEGMADLVVTMAAEAARYRAVEAAWGRRSGRTPASDARERVQQHLRKVAIIFSSHPQDRVEYLRSLFFALAARDVETMMQA